MSHFEPLLKKINFQFKNRALLEESFTHRSYLNEGGKERNSNERLEFLGDAVLSFLISKYLYAMYPDYPEGLLTNLRSTIVKTESLADIAGELDLGTYLYLSHGEEKGGGRNNPSLLADTFEAFLAAIFLDQGLAKASEFLENSFFPKIGQIIESQIHADYKSKLQEIVQEYTKAPPTYKVVKTEGPDHAKLFWVTVVIDGKEQEVGTGKSKQEAEQMSAAKTLEKMGKI